MPITLGTDKIEPTATAMLFLERKRSLYLLKLESCKFVAFIAATVVSAQDIECFLIATFGNKPSYASSISEGVAKM
jgi:predicted GNAT superfamily acetyltransferase